MLLKTRRMLAVLAAGGLVFQSAGCGGLAAETLVRTGFSTVFLPINQAILTFFSIFNP